MAKSRQAVVNLVKSWDGKKESNGSHKSIIDLYNDFFEKICAGKFPRGIRMRYDWAWCACTWSALAAALRYESIMPMEISCYYLIEAAKKMGCWQENDAYVPSPGDAILYDWQDNGIGDNTGNPDHVGTVIEVHKESGYMVIEEGNHSNAVKKRTLSINGKFIRGFITPKYDDNTVAAPGLSKDKDIKPTKEMIKVRHKLVYDITTRLESFSLNTVVSKFMEYNNKMIDMAKKTGGIDKETLSTYVILLSPFAPHIAEELWQVLGHDTSVFAAKWPEHDEDAMKDDEVEVPVQINGKTRAVISIPVDISKEDAIAKGKEAVADKLTGTIVKEIYVPKKIINIVQK